MYTNIGFKDTQFQNTFLSISNFLAIVRHSKYYDDTTETEYEMYE